jgi:serine/threonine protein phosphatase PrpC
MPFEFAKASLLGNRSMNQDRCAVFNQGEHVLMLLADGMGGHPRGEVAAQILVDTGRKMFEDTPKPVGDPLGFLDDILGAAHEEIVAYGRRQDPPIDPRATAVAVLVQDSRAFWIHAGDSRFYLFRSYQALYRTRDHSFVEQLHERGVKPKDHDGVGRYRNLVTQCLGGNGLRFGTTRGVPTSLKPRDILMLCSDGLWGQIPDQDLCSLMRHHGSLDRMVAQLAENAVQLGAPSSDNVTVLALRWRGGKGPKRKAAAELGVAADSNGEVRDALAHLRAVVEEFETGEKEPE